MSKLFNIIKKVVIASFFIYGYNLIAQSLNILIPLNIITISYVTLFGIPGLLSLIIIFIFSF